MSSYYATSRTNYFRVKDEAAFRAWLATTGLKLWEGSDANAGAFALGPNEFSDTGTLDLPYDNEQDDRPQLTEMLAPHLAEGSVCVLMEAGAEKLRYVCGNAVAFDHTGACVQVNLNDIYKLAEARFGVTPVACEY